MHFYKYSSETIHKILNYKPMSPQLYTHLKNNSWGLSDREISTSLSYNHPGNIYSWDSLFPGKEKNGASWKIAALEFYNFLKSTCLLLTIFLKFIFYQKEKWGIIWSRLSILNFSSIRIFIQKKLFLNFKNIKINNFQF